MTESNYDERNAKLDAIVQPLGTVKYGREFPFSRATSDLLAYLGGDGSNEVELNPDFHRGHVWTNDQQRHYIENVMRGIVGQEGLTIRFNCAGWAGRPTGDLDSRVQSIDGLQRLTAIQKFMTGDVRPFGMTIDDLKGSRYDATRTTYLMHVTVHTFQYRADLLRYYLTVNDGGTLHTREELDRVRSLLAEA